MVTTEIGKQRLLQLAEHLKNGKLGHEHFDIGVIHEIWTCHSSGCAIGEFPVLWPEYFKYQGANVVPNLTNDFFMYNGWRSSRDFFDITEEDHSKLFYAHAKLPWLSGKMLSLRATKEEVAESIIAFTNWTEPNG